MRQNNQSPRPGRRIITPFFAGLGLAVAVAASLSPGVANAQDAEYAAIQQAIQQTAGAVVQIETIGASASQGELTLGAPISGTRIDDQGHILTSLWGLEETPASILIVEADGSRQPAELVARDFSRELVLLKTKPSGSGNHVALQRKEKVRVGQWAIAVGRGIAPETPSVSIGIVSATGRMYGRAVQIDARISPSFYGGPVVDIEGEMIGISVPMKPEAGSAGEKSDWYDSGIAFVVSAEAIASRIDQMKAGKDIRAGKLGIVPASKMPFSDDRTLSAVLALSPAKRAGIQADDELFEIDGEAVRWNADIKQLLGPRDAGEVLKIKVLRDEKELEFEVELAADIPAFRPRVLGVLADPQGESLEITHIFDDSAAAKAKLQIGDTIQAIDGNKIDDVDRARLLVMTHPPGEDLDLTVLRDGKPLDVRCDLQSTPDTVVAELPELKDPIGEEAWEIVPRSLPDVSNKSCLLKPKGDKGPQLGLLVLLARPGTEKLEPLVEAWRSVAAKHQLAILAIGPAEGDRWKPAESDVIVRLIQQTQQAINVAPQQIVVGGFGAGAEMSMLVALRDRELVRGGIAASGSRPGGFALSENDPASPVQFLVVGGTEMPVWGRVIANVGFPVLQQPSTEKEPLADDPKVRDAVGRWIRSLERI
ncbi:PDZ domain-containing protein [Rosistilla oblonga]|uniref:PDZ domain-containing protein n=1 Tax=Rosistilla oblonga TaxID=2527990 RepID=UPI003A9819F8